MDDAKNAEHSAPNSPPKVSVAYAELSLVFVHADHPEQPAVRRICVKSEHEALFEKASLDRAFELTQVLREQLEHPAPPAVPASPPKRRRLWKF